MTPMTPAQVKLFARLSDLATTAAVPVRSAAANIAKIAVKLRAVDGPPTNLQPVLNDLNHDLDAAVESLVDAMTNLGNIRRLLGLLSATSAVVAEAT